MKWWVSFCVVFGAISLGVTTHSYDGAVVGAVIGGTFGSLLGTLLHKGF